ncbi:MAG: M56 family metallopeptidase, partial [Kiritimatiellaceae bacterium]|nr:M56 family metallopeptidase [Kiritimatiellaceae bacterium]
MSTLIAFADRAGHVIWSLSWQLAVLVFLVWLVSLFCKNQSPGFRYLLWCVVLVRLCFPVDLSLPIPIAVGGHVEKAAEVSIAAVFIEPQHSRLPAFPRMNEPQFEPSFAPQATAMDFSQPAPVAEPEPIALSVPLVAAWAIIAIALAGLVMFRLIQANLFLRRCPPITDPDFLQHLETLRQSVGVRQKISVATVDPVKGNGGPFVFGTLRPCLLIPQYMLTEWSRKELEPVLLHELAHIKRKDLLVNFLQIMSQIVFFFHPLVWFANHRIRHERELACDDLAIAHCGSGCKRYSQSILRVIEERQNGQWIFSAATIGIAEQQNSLGKRIVRIMNKNYRFHQRMGV